MRGGHTHLAALEALVVGYEAQVKLAGRVFEFEAVALCVNRSSGRDAVKLSDGVVVPLGGEGREKGGSAEQGVNQGWANT